MWSARGGIIVIKQSSPLNKSLVDAIMSNLNYLSDRWIISFTPNNLLESSDQLCEVVQSEFPYATVSIISETSIQLELTHFIPFYYLEEKLKRWESDFIYDIDCF